ncbi:hypothetical protein DB32_006383 [Sandaracinus amylolyticus]|uniref:Uncharacterized protein n=1 Tax=Sandaracinus amylolyticus TaxID=927083 RepID=A0A0F6SGT1_9BACT|nr:hypothetical protein DB32_006383 [Sandaracinus amylolyticus]
MPRAQASVPRVAGVGASIANVDVERGSRGVSACGSSPWCS